ISRSYHELTSLSATCLSRASHGQAREGSKENHVSADRTVVREVAGVQELQNIKSESSQGLIF
ncbi:MAG TPA: hypothetical protein VI114_08520, partial [Chthoniobacterales bacterium]